MEHCAIDLGGRESQVCIRSSDGEILLEKKFATLDLPALLQRRPPSRVVLETAAEAFRIADTAMEAGHDVRVVPATLVRSLGVGARRTKTDRRDAQVLSEVSCRIDLPSVHIPSSTAREWKTIYGMHDVLVGSRTKLINNIRGWLRGQGYRIRKSGSTTFTRRVREISAVPTYVESQLQMIDALSEQILLGQKRLSTLAASSELCRRLMTVPGVGPSVALRYVSALDDATRFPSAHRVESYLGLAPGENSSSERQRRTGITKAGPSSVRWVLLQAAWVVRVHCRGAAAYELKRWAAQVAERRGTRIATVALARKLAGILYALWRDGTTYHWKEAMPRT